MTTRGTLIRGACAVTALIAGALVETCWAGDVTIKDGDTKDCCYRKNRRGIPHRLERCSYVAVRNPDRDDRLWRLKGERQVICTKASLSLAERIRAARELVRTAG